MKLAVVKPDHIGDLILSAAAIRAVLAHVGTATIFVSSTNLPLATHLFGTAAHLRSIDFPHLSKSGVSREEDVDLREFDLVLFLRHDSVINPAWAELRCRDYIFPIDGHLDHQAQLDYGVVAPVIGHYDVDAMQFGVSLAGLQRKAAIAPRSVGLCIGSGFHANMWAVSHWYALALRLAERDIGVSIVCGPSEAGLGAALARQLNLPPDKLIVGSRDLAGFLRRVDELDWVVASDGGVGHLCSLQAPVLSIFGPSPFLRYAPFGRWNRLLTRDLSCSPCCQWASTLVNGCLSMECMAGIDAADAVLALGPPYSSVNEAGAIRLRDGLQLYEGVSHLDLEYKLGLRLAPTQGPLIPGNDSKSDDRDHGPSGRSGLPDASDVAAAKGRPDTKRGAVRSHQRQRSRRHVP